MREIKFRAWDVAEKKMYENVGMIGTLVILEYSQGGYDFYEIELKSYDHHDEKVKVMQYTGLKDKNGKEIYEGDIISTDLDRPFNIVVFRNGAFMFQCHDNGKDYYDYMFSVDEEFDCWKFGEVIGNIYEHPYLLKGEENA